MPGMNDSFDEIHEGDRLSAKWLNNLAGSVSRMSRPNRSRMRTLINSCGNFTIPDDDPGVLFYNGDNSNSIPAYGVALRNGVKAAGGPDFVPQTKQPDQYAGQYPIVNGAASVSSGDFGSGQFLWNDVLILAYDSSTGTPAAGDMWGVGSGSYLLKKNYAGFIVDGIYDSTNHWLIGRWMQPTTVRGKPTPSQVASGNSGTLNVYVGGYGSETQPTGNPTIANVKNDSSCTVEVKISRVMYNPDNGLWQWTDAYTS